MKFSCLSFSILAAAFGAAAQDVVTEGSLLALLGDTHPSVRALGEELARAKAGRVRAGTLPNPRFEVLREQPDATNRQTTWTLGFTPPLDGRLPAAKEAADAGVEAARLRLSYERLSLRRELRRLYAEWETSTERARVLGRHAATASDLAAQARRRAEGGEASGVSATRLELLAEQERSALAIAEGESARADARVRALTGGVPPGAKPVRTVLPPIPPDDSAARPDIEALRVDVRQAELEEKLGRRFVVFPELTAGWQRVETQPTAQSGAVFGLAWSVPLFDRSQAARLEASRKGEVARARLAIRDAQAKADLASTRAAYETLRAASLHASETTRSTDRMLEGATAAFRAGEFTVTDLADALRASREALLSEIDLYAAAWQAHRDLELAVGRPLLEGGSR